MLKGYGISKDQRTKEGVPCILYGELYTTYKSEIIQDVVSRTDVQDEGLVNSKENDVIIPSSGETAADIATARCVLTSNVLLGGDLNIIRLSGNDGRFLCYELNGRRRPEIAKIAQGVSVVHLYAEGLKRIKIHLPSLPEQRKIANFLSLLDERIAVQRALIGEMGRLIGGIAEKVYRGKDDSYGKLGDFLEQVSERNRDGKITNILSVSNKYGFARQSEQFSNRTIASEDTSCYKVVTKDDFAYNPARINVGSIARLDTEESGIVSPMYICFHIKHSLNPIFLSNYFKSSKFQEQINRRLEGSVRQCLTFESLCEIPIPVPNMAFQNIASDAFVSLQSKLMNERAFLASLEKQKSYLLQKLFI